MAQKPKYVGPLSICLKKNRLIFLQFSPSSSTSLFVAAAHKTVGINWHLRNIWGYILSWYKLWCFTGADINREPHLWVSHTTFPFSVSGSHISELINLNPSNKQGKQHGTCWHFSTSHLCTLCSRLSDPNSLLIYSGCNTLHYLHVGKKDTQRSKRSWFRKWSYLDVFKQ